MPISNILTSPSESNDYDTVVMVLLCINNGSQIENVGPVRVSTEVSGRFHYVF